MEKINFTLSVLFILLIFLQWHHFCRPLFLESFRSRLFSLREDLFDYALSGKINFSDASYVILRSRINCLLRFAHRVSFTDIVVSSLFQRASLQPLKDDLNKAIKDIPNPESREFLELIRKSVQKRVVKHLWLSAPLLPFLMIIPFTCKAFSGLKRFCKLFMSNKEDASHLNIAAALKAYVDSTIELERNRVNAQISIQMERESLCDESNDPIWKARQEHARDNFAAV